MVVLQLSKNGHKLCFQILVCIHHIVHLIHGAPMHPPPGFAQSPISSPAHWNVAHDAGNSAVPQGFSVVQTALPAVQPVWKHSFVPVAYADHWSCEYEPVTWITNHLVPNPQQAQRQGTGVWLRPDAVPSQSAYSGGRHRESLTRERVPYEQTDHSRFRDPSRANTNLKSDGAADASKVQPQVVTALDGTRDSVPDPLQKGNAARKRKGLIPAPIVIPPRSFNPSGVGMKGKSWPYFPAKDEERIVNRAGITSEETQLPTQNQETKIDRAVNKAGNASDSHQTQGQHAPDLALPNSAKEKESATDQVRKSDSSKYSLSPHKTVADAGRGDHQNKISQTGNDRVMNIPIESIKTGREAHIEGKTTAPTPSAQTQFDSENHFGIPINAPVLAPQSSLGPAEHGTQLVPSADSKKTEPNLNKKDVSQSQRGESSASSDMTLNENQSPKKETISPMKAPIKSTKPSSEESVGSQVATPTTHADRNHFSSENHLGVPKQDAGETPKISPGPAENGIHVPAAVQSFKSALLKNTVTSDAGKKTEGEEQMIEQTIPNLRAHSINAQDTKPGRISSNHSVKSKPQNFQYQPVLAKKITNFQANKKAPTTDHISAATETKGQNRNIKDSSLKKKINTSTSEVQNDSGGAILKNQFEKIANKDTRAQDGTAHGSKNSYLRSYDMDSKPEIDSTLLDQEVPRKETSAPENQEAHPKKVESTMTKSDQSNNENEQMAAILEKGNETPPEHSNKRKKKKKSKSPKTSPDKSEAIEAHEDPKNVITDPEKQVPDKDDETQEAARKKVEVKFDDQRKLLEMDFEMKKLKPKSRHRLDEEASLYERLYLAFHPGSNLAEDEIFPGIKRPKPTYKLVEDKAIDPPEADPQHKTEEVDDPNLKKRLEFWDPEWVQTWKSRNLDLNLMDNLSRHLKVKDKTPDLALEDMKLDRYQLFRDICSQNQKKFMQAQFWISGDEILEVDETKRRMKTTIKQISELTILENWKLIGPELINRKLLTRKEVEKIESFYNLSIYFPNPINYLPKRPLGAIKDKRKDVLEDIEKSLGIEDSMRPKPLPIHTFPDKSPISRSRRELYESSRHNGVDIITVLFVARLYNAGPQAKASLAKMLEESTRDELVPWHICAERHWLIKYFNGTA
ncbi:hypothetical protein PGTUg99_016659 [Puccinia graminis f. sp. tritici]|uniref:Uncharacterized protein n=1 Tax=Puccinia graminis f. sp. tritici TaxID=56615 RepID=A0A5B0SK48_PUCGR|nr:hypothetical protein PGTUg99_016659 [Puccinia graminis f. sp. tritici]